MNSNILMFVVINLLYKVCVFGCNKDSRIFIKVYLMSVNLLGVYLRLKRFD